MRRRRKKCPFTNLFLELKSFWSFVEDERQGTFNDVRGPEFCLRRGIIQMLLTKKKEILATGSRVYRELDNRANKTRRTAGLTVSVPTTCARFREANTGENVGREELLRC